MKKLPFFLFVASLVGLGCSLAQNRTSQTPSFPQFNFSRVLIVSGGPDATNNQYAIESNARYLESLTRRASWRRILFADGKSANRTLATLAEAPQTRARAVAAWLLDLEFQDDVVFRAPTLRPIDGATTPKSVAAHLKEFGKDSEGTAPQLVYFTGHGSEGATFLGTPDLDNTLYNGWGGDISTRQLSRILQESPAQSPLVLVMVQCHSGGFANAIFKDGVADNGIWNRDFCGFFAATPDRQSAGCTAQVDERDYQDFTTHFFAALSGRSRDGRQTGGADFDKNGEVSFNEAFAYAQIRDDSIDVPLNTSDAYLRHLYGQTGEESWANTPFSTLTKDATPWQNAILRALSIRLRLSGDNRLQTARRRLQKVRERIESGDVDWNQIPASNRRAFGASFARQEANLKKRFAHADRKSPTQQAAILDSAARFLLTQKHDYALLKDAYDVALAQGEKVEVEEAHLLRMLRVARSVALQKRLEREGTPAQRSVLQRLRTSENRAAMMRTAPQRG